MKLVHIQQALFSAYDMRNAMSDEYRRKPTEGENMGACLDEIIDTLEQLEMEMERHNKVITIGRFSITYAWRPNVAFCGSAFGWEDFTPDGFDGSPEEKHLEKIEATINADYSEEEYIDKLVSALERNPFTQGETV